MNFSIYKTKILNNDIFEIKFLDFSKSFDLLSHDAILNNLKNIGLRDKELKWFEEYLTGRQAAVRLDNHLCNLRQWKHGVPQGSKLGPVLYIITTNEIPKHLPEVQIFSYADDIAILVSSSDIDVANRRMKETIRRIQQLTHDLGLVINNKKTKITLRNI